MVAKGDDMEREIRLLSGEVIKYQDRDEAWWLAATGGTGVLGRPVSEWKRPADQPAPKVKWPTKVDFRSKADFRPAQEPLGVPPSSEVSEAAAGPGKGLKTQDSSPVQERDSEE